MQYSSVARPIGGPPAWLFGPAWFVIYAAYGALGVILIARRTHVRPVLWALYALAWGVNLLWLPLFRDRIVAYANGLYIALLLVFVLQLAGVLWASADPWLRRGALLLLPYVAWLCVASSLGFALYHLN